MENISAKAPWKNHLGEVPFTLDYFDGSMFEAVEKIAEKYPNNVAFDFMGRSTTYKALVREVEDCAKALRTIGVREGDKVTIAMPNCPQAIQMFYAVNLIGGICNMIHPLSAEKEIEFYLNESESVTAITLDQFYNKFENIRQNTKVVNIVIASIKDELSKPVKAGYMLTEGRKIKKIPEDAPVIRWKEFLHMGKHCFYNYKVKRTGKDPAVILYSGGTTGTTKGILLSNMNFNALGLQTIAASGFAPINGMKMLSVMPVFHGFGLGIGIHTALIGGACCILVPKFNVNTYAELLIKKQPNIIPGVPTLFEALLRAEKLENADLSCLKGVFCGGASLSIELKKKVDAFLKSHNASVQIRQGYGLTECVTASCLTPKDYNRVGSIGVPFPDTYYKIVKPGTTDEIDPNVEGEICISGPSVMLRYVDNPEETEHTLRRHDDGRVWLHTGDLGKMDEDGFVYFSQRIKRMIITSGYNVYPGQLENVIDGHEKVLLSCVIGVKDPYKIQKVKAFVVLRPGYEPSDEVKQEILEYCKGHIAKYAMPYDIEFRAELPKTLVGKVAYRVLEEEEAERQASLEQNEE